jgi:NhaA family Na+:H+ antiporter
MIGEKTQKAIDLMREFQKLESAGGLLLIGATGAALLLANIPVANRLYAGWFALHLTVTLGGLGVDKPLLPGSMSPDGLLLHAGRPGAQA